MTPSAARQKLGLRTRYTPAELKAAYRRAAFTAHPDHGGSNEAFHAVQEAMTVLQGGPASNVRAEGSPSGETRVHPSDIPGYGGGVGNPFQFKSEFWSNFKDAFCGREEIRDFAQAAGFTSGESIYDDILRGFGTAGQEPQQARANREEQEKRRSRSKDTGSDYGFVPCASCKKSTFFTPGHNGPLLCSHCRVKESIPADKKRTIRTRCPNCKTTLKVEV